MVALAAAFPEAAAGAGAEALAGPELELEGWSEPDLLQPVASRPVMAARDAAAKDEVKRRMFIRTTFIV
jgi:hypothetical protein